MNKVHTKQKVILIIDDDEFLTSLYAQKFVSSGYIVEVAQDGDEGIKKVSELNPDAVILDVLMHGKDGLDVLKELRANSETKDQLVLVLSNLDEKQKIGECQHQNIFDYIIKAHVTPDEVVERIKDMLETEK